MKRSIENEELIIPICIAIDKKNNSSKFYFVWIVFRNAFLLNWIEYKNPSLILSEDINPKW